MISLRGQVKACPLLFDLHENFVVLKCRKMWNEDFDNGS